MSGRRRAPRWYGFGLGAILLVGTAAGEAPSGLAVELHCRPEAAPGRVLCELKCAVAPGKRLVWADALVTAAPDFARPLRSRVAPERFAPAAATERKLSLALVASKPGVGQVTVRARAVVCQGEGDAERCHPESREARAELRVGS